MTDLSRRALLAAAAAVAPMAAMAADPAALARDEAHWAKVASLYDAPPSGVIQLENGQFGAMAKVVRAAYEQKIARVNRETTLYTRGPVGKDLMAVRAKVAALLRVSPEEIAFTRGGSESMVTLIAGYNRLKPGDAVLYADLDYDSMQDGMESLARLRGVRVVKFNLPEPATRQGLIDAYEAALKANPDVRLMLLTHLSHRTGLIPPVKEITALARSRGVDVLLDCGHALGQTEFTLKDLGIEFAGLNLHKWIGSPLGVGVVYIAKDRIPDIDVSLLEPPGSARIDARVHTGTVNYAAVLAVSDAIDMHESIGLAAKAERMRYLRDRWVAPLRGRKGIEILTPDEPGMHAGITSFRLTGKTSVADNVAVRKALFDQHRIFTIERVGVAKGACVRVAPFLINTPADLDALVKALTAMTA